MKKATPKNVKPGTWLRTSKEDRQFDPDGLFRCVKIQWSGDFGENNQVTMDVFYNYETKEWVFNSPFQYNLPEDMGLTGSDVDWDEIMGNFSVYDNKREIIKDIMQNPVE